MLNISNCKAIVNIIKKEAVLQKALEDNVGCVKDLANWNLIQISQTNSIKGTVVVKREDFWRKDAHVLHSELPPLVLIGRL